MADPRPNRESLQSEAAEPTAERGNGSGGAVLARGEVLSDAISDLSRCADDALSKAVCEGILDPEDVIDWAVRVQRLILFQRDRSALRAELPTLTDRLESMLDASMLPSGMESEAIAMHFVEQLAEVRRLLAADVEAAFDGDPAAKSFAEIVLAYPSIRALSMHRISHLLYGLDVPLLPRIMSEYAHDRTGIDIHPGAEIGSRFFIDHGTGVVIGETTVIGNSVKLYQGVTLGALSPRHGESLRGVKRHPTIEDEVTIYAGATILGGGTTIGRGTVIGGNVWLTESVPAGSKVVAEPARQLVHRRAEADEASALQLHWDI